MPDVFVDQETTLPQNQPKQSDAPKDAVGKLSRSQNVSQITTHQPIHNISFQGQEGDERILLVVRKSLFTNIPWILTVVLLIIVSFFLPYLFGYFTFLPSSYMTLFLLLYYLIISIYIFIKIITWYYNISIVTHKRLIDIDFSDLTYHDVAFTNLANIEDVHYTQAGVFRSLFNFGDVYALTASDKANFEALGVPNPRDVADTIADLTGKKKHV